MNMPLWVLLVSGALLGWWFFRRRQMPPAEHTEIEAAPTEAPDAADDAGTEGAPATIPQCGSALSEAYDDSTHPQELEGESAFQLGVALLRDPAMPLAQVITYAMSGNGAIEAMAGRALAERDDGADALDRLIMHTGSTRVWSLYFYFRALVRHAPPSRPVVSEVLVRAQHWWPDNPTLLQFLSDLADTRVAAGEVLDIRPVLADTPSPPFAFMISVLERMPSTHAAVLLAQLTEWQRTQLNVTALQQVGRVDRFDAAGTTVLPVDEWRDAIDDCTQALTGDEPCGIVILGESGTGKTTFFRAVAARVREAGWHVFEASATDVMAGQSFIGELEQRIRDLFENLDAQRRVIWYVPNIHELVFAGQHRQSPTGVLDMILPAVESGRLRVVGETVSRAYERLVQERPRVRGTFRTVRLEPLTPAGTTALALRVAEAEFAPAGLTCDPALLQDCVDLARHYFSSRALPGSALDLLRSTRTRVTAAGATTITRADVIDTLATLTGLPRSVLDDREGLDSTSIRDYFDARVMGQPEAVQCLIDRVAMLKAGLTDPNRPVGVFLFAGPTGTGKTEVAKTLATYLFGAADRMIRLDMSEFQDSASLTRILGESGSGFEVDALVNRIRKQPFSVVLLDEFEKAHPQVWDLFLQVFDDGRLTDARGNLADFRHSIIILTTNLGATAHKGSSLGFNEGDSPFSEAQVNRAISQAFRPEFVNRLDRVVVFRPLSRAVMRRILEKELHDVLQRRGFRSRDWAVEWEDSAIEFLLDKGFTKDLGARPLRRAIDQHVLAPIALTIVEHRFPEGDQFLFVRSNGQAIDVQFVDPDAPGDAGAAPAEPVPAPTLPAGLTLRSLILAPEGTEAARAFLEQALHALQTRLEDAEWLDAKAGYLRRIGETGFWEADDRYAVTDRFERMDRIDAGAQTAKSLLQRLDRRPRGEDKLPRTVVASLAEQLYLLQMALEDIDEDIGFDRHGQEYEYRDQYDENDPLDGGPSADVHLVIDRVAGDPRTRHEEEHWMRAIVEMYRQWAKTRRMHCTTVGGDPSREIVLAVSGFGARQILRRERGLHVLEVPEDTTNFDRRTVRVNVVPQLLGPGPANVSEFDLALATAHSAASQYASTVVRRYREKPSPLVRDAVRNWRTGHFRQVLEGAFDLME